MQIQSFCHSVSLKTLEAFKSLQKIVYNGMHILSGQGTTPPKAPAARLEIFVLRSPDET